MKSSRPTRNFFRRKRRYLSATYAHADLSKTTEPPLREKIWRRLFKLEYCDADGSTARATKRTRRWLFLPVLLLLAWFIAESILAWDIFSGPDPTPEQKTASK
ncbi:MAG: hypothetical protein LBS59_05845 [Puniceicoccales bacterium]|jgi:hypothetical protein|nr:hypothetical protein [Puniceicoccales bacterium]